MCRLFSELEVTGEAGVEELLPHFSATGLVAANSNDRPDILPEELARWLRGEGTADVGGEDRGAEERPHGTTEVNPPPPPRLGSPGLVPPDREIFGR